MFITGLLTYFTIYIGYKIIEEIYNDKITPLLLKSDIKNNKIQINEYQLIIGHHYYSPIIIDMLITPHILVCGLSNSGKSKMIEYAVKNKNVIFLNTFYNDYKTVKARKINGNDNISKFLNDMLNKPFRRSVPLFIVIDELIILCLDKTIEKAITNLLTQGRHYNIFVIGICQIGTKESIKFKDLFNTRICFKQVEESSYRAVLGYSPEERDLKQREFFYYSDKVGKGYTYEVE